VALKSADIGHTAKPPRLHRMWTRRVLTEMWRQGDRERAEGFDISPMCDRNRFSDIGAVATSQVGFLEFVCVPLFRAWDRLSVASLRELYFEAFFTPLDGSDRRIVDSSSTPSFGRDIGAHGEQEGQDDDDGSASVSSGNAVQRTRAGRRALPELDRVKYDERKCAATLAYAAEHNKAQWARVAEAAILDASDE
jgi:hypothetical protein